MPVTLANSAREKSEKFYRLCLHSSNNTIDFQCMKNVHEHLTVDIVVLYALNSLLRRITGFEI